jgi:hypothetical protein
MEPRPITQADLTAWAARDAEAARFAGEVTAPEDPEDAAALVRASARLVHAALGSQGAFLACMALCAGWLTPAEAATLRPLAAELGRQLGEDLPPHRGARAGRAS